MNNLLSLITFLPAVAAVVLALFLRGNDAAAQRNAKWLALIATTATLLVSLILLKDFDPANTGMQFVEEATWIAGLKYKLGVDGISVLFVLLTTFLMPITILSCCGVTDRVKDYMIAFLLLETLMLGVFMALDLVLFYLFFEAGLIPMFLIIGICGGHHRHSDADDLRVRVRDLLGAGDHGCGRVANAAVPCLLRLFRGEDADVAGAYVVARCPRSGPHGWLCRAGGDHAEDGRLWLPALQPADVSGWQPCDDRSGTVDVGDRHRLHQPCRAGAVGYEKADRLFLGGPHGLRDDGDFRREPARH